MNFREGGPKSSPRTKAREVNQGVDQAQSSMRDKRVCW